MSNRLPLQLRQQVIECLQKGMTQRKIAEKLGMSRGTVAVIALRGHAEFPSSNKQLSDVELEKCPPYRCSGCHRNVCYSPCLICEARATAREGKTPREPENTDEDPIPERVERETAIIKKGKLERYKTVLPRWRPPTFATPIYHIPGIED